MAKNKEKYHKPKFCKYPIDQMLKELRREQDMREHVYKSQIESGKLQKSTAVKRWHLLNDVMKVLKAYNRIVVGEQSSLFDEEDSGKKNKYEPEN